MINGSINYTYDTLSRLTKESGNLDTKSFSIDYTYDKAGNRLTSTEDNQLIAYSYNNLNQLALASGGAPKLIQVKGTVTEASPFTVKVNGKPAAVSGNQFTADNVSLYPGTNAIKADATDSSGNVGSCQVTVTYNSASPQALSYVYDKNGNLIQRIAGQNIENFNYDYENRVKTYASSGSSVIYAYDGLGRRVSKSNNGTTTKYYYDSNELVLEKTGSNLVYYIHGPQVDEIISDSRGYCYHYDGLGSVSNVTDNSGVHAATYNYKAFGVIRSQSGSISSQWGFTGRQYDAESGFYYYRNRYYDPRTGRFITRDPIGMVDGPNLYTYCSNNPVNFVDPWGLCSGEPGLQEDLLTELGLGFAPALLARGVGYAVSAGLSAGTKSVLYFGENAWKLAAASSGIPIFKTPIGMAMNWIQNSLKIQLPRIAWDAASAIYAAGARGTVQVFSTVSDYSMEYYNSTFARIEAPIIEALDKAEIVFR